NPVEEFIKELSGEIETKMIKNKLGENYKYYQKMESITKQTGVVARMPFDMDIH
ncbi:MAG: hypothetical protein HRT73_04615, partial [Flavobacteriales bacterium]|nr:hypothetical protein [Flavobacteriales bacterium]